MRALAEQGYHRLCLSVGRLLRAGRYSTTRIAERNGERRAVKQRRFYAPLLVRLGGPLTRILDTGVRVLPQREWEDRERLLHERLRDTMIGVDADGALVLPFLVGETLAALLETPTLARTSRARALELAVAALADFHRLGFTHGDAMAENVMVELEAGAAHWFDFETIHDPARPLTWRRADDVRALLATCLLRTAAASVAETVELVLDVYGDEAVRPFLVASFASPVGRPLAFHLGQAGLSYQRSREIADLLRARAARSPAGT